MTSARDLRLRSTSCSRILVAEDGDNAGRQGEGQLTGRRLYQRAQLLLVEVFLERPPRRDEAVPIEAVACRRNLALDHDGDTKRLLGETPGGSQGLRPLARVLDHVDDEAQVHHIGRLAQSSGGVVRVPAECVEALARQRLHVLPLSTPIVEDAAPGRDDAKAHHELHGLREMATHNGGPVQRHLVD